MSKRVFVLYVMTTGIREIFEIFKDFTIISCTARRRTQIGKQIDQKAHLGATFGSRQDNYLVLNHSSSHQPLDVNKLELLQGIDRFNLKDVTIDNIELISNKKIKLGDEPKEYWLKFESEFVKNDKLGEEFDKKEYNNRLMELTRKRSVLRLTMCCSKKDHITLPISKRHFLVNLKDHWRKQDLEQRFIEEHNAYSIRNFIGKDWCVVASFKETSEKGFELERIMNN